MPPYFPYLTALTGYVALSVCALAIAAVLAVVPPTRSFAKKLAAGVCGSFPGVFLFQVLVVPIVMLLLLLVMAISAILPQGGNAQGVVVVGLAFLIFFIFAGASLAGFYTGFWLAWDFAAGRPPRDLLKNDTVIGPVVRLVGRHISLVRRILS